MVNGFNLRLKKKTIFKYIYILHTICDCLPNDRGFTIPDLLSCLIAIVVHPICHVRTYYYSFFVIVNLIRKSLLNYL